MVPFELLQFVRVFLNYLRIEYLWHVLIMPLTNRNGITSLEVGGIEPHVWIGAIVVVSPSRLIGLLR
jgi:hypothetical protein